MQIAATAQQTVQLSLVEQSMTAITTNSASPKNGAPYYQHQGEQSGYAIASQTLAIASSPNHFDFSRMRQEAEAWYDEQTDLMDHRAALAQEEFLQAPFTKTNRNIMQKINTQAADQYIVYTIKTKFYLYRSLSQSR